MTDVDLVAELPIIQRLAAALGTELDRASVVAHLRGNVAHSGVLVGSRGRPKPLAPPVHQQLAAQRCGCRALRLQPRAQGQQQSSTTVLSAQVTDATTAKQAKPPQIGSPMKPCTSREALRAMRACEYLEHAHVVSKAGWRKGEPQPTPQLPRQAPLIVSCAPTSGVGCQF